MIKCRPILGSKLMAYAEHYLALDPSSPSGLVWKDYPANSKKQWGDKTGEMAGAIGTKGYYAIRIANTTINAHRLVWAMHYQEEPPAVIDHINRDKTDNRIENLRALTHLENVQNWRGKGYSVDKRSGKYQAAISINGKVKWLGYYGTASEAEAAYLKAKAELHPSYAA